MPTAETLRALNSMAADVVVLAVVALRKADGSFVTLRLATRECAGPDGESYFGAITDPGIVSQPGKFLSSDVSPCTCTLKLAASAHARAGLTVRDLYRGDYIWLGSSVELAVWETSTSEAVTTLRASVGEPSMSGGVLSLSLRQRLDWNRSITPAYITREDFPGAPEESIGGTIPTVLGRVVQLPMRKPPFANAYENSEDLAGHGPYADGMGNGVPFVAGGRRLAQGLLVDAGRGTGSARVLMASHRLASLGDLATGTPLFMELDGEAALIRPATIFNGDDGAGFLLDDDAAYAYLPLYPTALDEAFLQERDTVYPLEGFPDNARAILDRWNDANPVTLYEGAGNPRRLICQVRSPSGRKDKLTALTMLVAADCSVPRSHGSSQTSILPYGWCHDGDSGPAAVGACYAGASFGVAQWWLVSCPLPTLAADEDESARWDKLGDYRLCFGDFTTLFVDGGGSRWSSALQTALQGRPRLYCAGLVAKFIPAQTTLITARTVTESARPEGSAGPYTIVLKDVPAVSQLEGKFFGNLSGQPDDADNHYTGADDDSKLVVPASTRTVYSSTTYATLAWGTVANAPQMSDGLEDTFDSLYVRSSVAGQYPRGQYGVSWVLKPTTGTGISLVRFRVRMRHSYTGNPPTKNELRVFQLRGSTPAYFCPVQYVQTGTTRTYTFDAATDPDGLPWTAASLAAYKLGWVVDHYGGNTNTSYGDTWTVMEFTAEVFADAFADRPIERPCDLSRYVLARYGGESLAKFGDDFVSARALLRDKNGDDMTLGLVVSESTDVMTALAWLNSNALTWTFLSPSSDIWRHHVWYNPAAVPARRLSLSQFLEEPTVATTFDSSIAPSVKVTYSPDGLDGSMMHETGLAPDRSNAGFASYLQNDGSLAILSAARWLDFYWQSGPTQASVQLAAGDHTFATMGDALHNAIRATPLFGLRWSFGFGGHAAWRSHILDFQDTQVRGAGLNTNDTSETEHPMEEFAAIVQAQMEANTSVKGYRCAYDHSTHRFTLSHVSATFSLLFGSGANLAHSAAAVLGFIPEDKTGATSYTSDFPIRAGQFALSSSGFFALQLYSGAHGYASNSPPVTAHSALGFVPYADGPIGTQAGQMLRFALGQVPKTTQQASLARAVARYIAADAEGAARRDMVLDGRCLYDGGTAVEVRNRLVDLLSRPHVVVSGTVLRAFGMERGEVIDFSDDMLAASYNPEPDGDGAWEGKAFVVVEAHQRQGPDSLAVEFTAIGV